MDHFTDRTDSTSMRVVGNEIEFRLYASNGFGAYAPGKFSKAEAEELHLMLGKALEKMAD